MARKKKLTEENIQEYIISRSEEALKEIIMKDDLLKENKAFREIFRGGFYAGMNVQAKIMNDVGKEMSRVE